MLKQFPSPEVREKIHNSIMSYTTGRTSRLDMMSYIYGTLTSYGVKKMAVRNYIVRCTQPVETPIGTFPVIIIESKGKVHSSCPTCESNVYGYLAGEAPTIKVMCHSCGAYYERAVPNEAVNAGG